jgi:SRSO17 transposase
LFSLKTLKIDLSLELIEVHLSVVLRFDLESNLAALIVVEAVRHVLNGLRVAADSIVGVGDLGRIAYQEKYKLVWCLNADENIVDSLMKILKRKTILDFV